MLTHISRIDSQYLNLSFAFDSRTTSTQPRHYVRSSVPGKKGSEKMLRRNNEKRDRGRVSVHGWRGGGGGGENKEGERKGTEIMSSHGRDDATGPASARYKTSPYLPADDCCLAPYCWLITLPNVTKGYVDRESLLLARLMTRSARSYLREEVQSERGPPRRAASHITQITVYGASVYV